MAAWETLPALNARVKNIALASPPPGDTHFLAHDRGGHVDHHVLYYGTDAESLAALRKADVIFLGNSRLMFAMQSRVLAPFFAAHDLDYFVLGFGFNEGDAYPLALIERFQVSPRLIVANVDGFFGAGLSEWAHEVVADSPFGARKRQWEAEAAHEARRLVHRLVPNWLDLLGRPGFAYGREFIAYRSRRDGTWVVSPWPAGTGLVTPQPLDQPEPGRGEIAAAQRFQEIIAARGGRLVLTSVPTPRRAGGGPARFAALLGVPLIAPTTAPLTTHDDSHLDPASAHEWARAFVTALEPHLPATAAGSR